MSHDRDIEANIAESDSFVVAATTDIGQFQWKSYDNVSGAHSIDAGINLSNGNAGARVHSDTSIACHTRANAWDYGEWAISENHYKQYEGNAIIGSVGERDPFILFGTNGIGAATRFPHIHGKSWIVLCLRLK